MVEVVKFIQSTERAKKSERVRGSSLADSVTRERKRARGLVAVVQSSVIPFFFVMRDSREVRPRSNSKA